MEQVEYAQANLPTAFGDFRVFVWPGRKGNEPTALVTPQLDIERPVLVRIHSECLTGDVFGSLLCDCGEQAAQALEKIAESKNGVFVYHRQEGRGIGLFEKIRAYAIQQKEKINTFEANVRLGHEADMRDYADPVRILKALNVKHAVLLTNNPRKTQELKDAGFAVEQEQFSVPPNKHNKEYLKAKQEEFDRS